MVVLGISINSRKLGIAVIRKNVLVDFKTQLHKEQWSKSKATRMIESLDSCITEHSITNVALLVQHAYHRTPQTTLLIDQITAHCKKKKISISTYHPQALHCFCEATKAKKKTLQTVMVKRYPELIHKHQKELNNKNKYYSKLFEAVGVATLLAEELNSTT